MTTSENTQDTQDTVDVVYSLGTGSRWDNNELRYSLRSLEKNVTGVRNVIIVGEKPSWLQNVIHIECRDRHRNKARNIMDKVHAACWHADITSEFAFMNDDYFFVKPINLIGYPHYHKCTLERTLEINKTEYYQHAKATKELLEWRNKKTDNYDVHRPIIYNKAKLLATIASVDWNIPFGHILKSLYCNLNDITGPYLQDRKTVRPLLKKQWDEILKLEEVDCISVDDRAMNFPFKAMLLELFPEKSRYEK